MKVAGIKEEIPLEDANVVMATSYEMAYRQLKACDYDDWVRYIVRVRSVQPGG